MMKRRLFLALAAALIIAICPVGAIQAAQLAVSSYDMYNGATGSYDYRDFTYPSPNADVSGAFLSGGTGKLTDGVSPVSSWYQYGWYTPWVGWDSGQGLANPTITFNFNNTVNINSVTVWVDNTIGYGGVSLPSSFSVNGMNYVIAPDNSNPNPRAYTFSGLNISGTSVDVQFFQSSSQWLMVGEVTFNGSTAVPLPGALFLFAPGLAGLAILRKRFK